MWCSVLQCVAVCCSSVAVVHASAPLGCFLERVPTCVAVCCSVLQCVAVQCRLMQCVRVFPKVHPQITCGVLQSVAAVLQCVAVYDGVSHHTSV